MGIELHAGVGQRHAAHAGGEARAVDGKGLQRLRRRVVEQRRHTRGLRGPDHGTPEQHAVGPLRELRRQRCRGRIQARLRLPRLEHAAISALSQ